MQRGIGDSRVPCTLEFNASRKETIMSTAAKKARIAGVFYLLTTNF